jgi:hypothetical protein
MQKAIRRLKLVEIYPDEGDNAKWDAMFEKMSKERHDVTSLNAHLEVMHKWLSNKCFYVKSNYVEVTSDFLNTAFADEALIAAYTALVGLAEAQEAVAGEPESTTTTQNTVRPPMQPSLTTPKPQTCTALTPVRHQSHSRYKANSCYLDSAYELYDAAAKSAVFQQRRNSSSDHFELPFADAFKPVGNALSALCQGRADLLKLSDAATEETIEECRAVVDEARTALREALLRAEGKSDDQVARGLESVGVLCDVFTALFTSKTPMLLHIATFVDCDLCGKTLRSNRRFRAPNISFLDPVMVADQNDPFKVIARRVNMLGVGVPLQAGCFDCGSKCSSVLESMTTVSTAEQAPPLIFVDVATHRTVDLSAASGNEPQTLTFNRVGQSSLVVEYELIAVSVYDKGNNHFSAFRRDEVDHAQWILVDGMEANAKLCSSPGVSYSGDGLRPQIIIYSKKTSVNEGPLTSEDPLVNTLTTTPLIKEASEAVVPPIDYGTLKCLELQAECRRLHFRASGTKQQLIDRLSNPDGAKRAKIGKQTRAMHTDEALDAMFDHNVLSRMPARILRAYIARCVQKHDFEPIDDDQQSHECAIHIKAERTRLYGNTALSRLDELSPDPPGSLCEKLYGDDTTEKFAHDQFIQIAVKEDGIERETSESMFLLLYLQVIGDSDKGVLEKPSGVPWKAAANLLDYMINLATSCLHPLDAASRLVALSDDYLSIVTMTELSKNDQRRELVFPNKVADMTSVSFCKDAEMFQVSLLDKINSGESAPARLLESKRHTEPLVHKGAPPPLSIAAFCEDQDSSQHATMMRQPHHMRLQIAQASETVSSLHDSSLSPTTLDVEMVDNFETTKLDVQTANNLEIGSTRFTENSNGGDLYSIDADISKTRGRYELAKRRKLLFDFDRQPAVNIERQRRRQHRVATQRCCYNAIHSFQVCFRS